MRRSAKNLGVLDFVRKELKKDSSERNIMVILLFITVLSGSVLFFFLVNYAFISGYASVESQGGYIQELTIHEIIPTVYWSGVYGLSLRVSNFTELLYGDFDSGEIIRQDLFFDCIDSSSEGGSEVYASTSNVIDFDSLEPADPVEIDNFTGCSGDQCAANTFTDFMNVSVGTRLIENVPSSYTKRYDGNQSVFDIGILKDGLGNLVYVTHLTSIQRSYNYEKIVNFQLLLPNPPNATTRFYFFTDPYDVCPAGSSVGDTIRASLKGFVFDSEGNPVENVSIVVAGHENFSSSNGSYSLSFDSLEGTYSVLVTKDGFDPLTSNITINFTNYTFLRNFTLSNYTPGSGDTLLGEVQGYVLNSAGGIVYGATVMAGDARTSSDSSGYYYLRSNFSINNAVLVSFKTGYENYYSILNFTNGTSIDKNITLITVEQQKQYTTGPYSESPGSNSPTQEIIQGDDYWISAREINKEVRKNTFVRDFVGIYNLRNSQMSLLFSVSPEISDFVKLDKSSLTLSPGNSDGFEITIYGTPPIGEYSGFISIGGGIEQDIPVNIKIVKNKFPIETLLVEVNLFKDVYFSEDVLKYKLNFKNLLRDQSYLIHYTVKVINLDTQESYFSEEYDSELKDSLTLIDEIDLPKDLPEGDYVLQVEARYLDSVSTAVSSFRISRPVYLYSFFGVPLWVLLVIISSLSFLAFNFVLYKRYRDKNKRYKIGLDYSTLAKQGDSSVKIGLIAETKHPAYYELDKLTTHAIVAGATGMGKSISAQVIVEEALKKGISVVVFDPTAQWSGMLRKCNDKKMLAYYPKFGLKSSDAQAFKGNVRQVKSAREYIDINKHLAPGQIQIFSLNKLDSKDMDIFVSNIIRGIFKSNPKEYPSLKTLLVFDEVHRLLPKFGGSGQGFLQIERACREFRKWGVGMLLISQVLSDFVGEIKANINTEIQTRTLEESDLARIRTKYGDGFLKSLVKAEVGVAMFQNASYNNGRPFFVNFRPILHSTRRLPDEELEKYNKYNEIIDDFEYQIEQLEEEKVDVFDLKLELKLIKNKLMTGSFSVVEIYVEGLKPRLEKEFEKLGKKPKKRELKLVDEKEILESIEEAKRQREEVEKKEAEEKKESKGESKDEEERGDQKDEERDEAVKPKGEEGNEKED